MSSVMPVSPDCICASAQRRALSRRRKVVLPQVHQEKRDRRGCNARNPYGLSDGRRMELIELHDNLGREPLHRAVVQILRQRSLLVLPLSLDLLLLMLDIPLVLYLDLNLLRDLRIRGHLLTQNLLEPRVAHLRAAEDLLKSQIARNVEPGLLLHRLREL